VRSTAALHAPGDSARTGWDRDGPRRAAGGGRIAAISAHIRQHLARHYHIPPGALIDLPSGVTDSD
jgi:hypothetical protein